MQPLETGFVLKIMAVAAVVTYLLRVIPLLVLRKPLKNPYLVAILEYLPYALLSAMLFPGIFYSTVEGACFPGVPPVSSVAGAVVALVLGFFGLSLPLVAAAATIAAVVFQYLLV